MENMFHKDESSSAPAENYRLEGPAETTREIQDELMEVVEKYYKDHGVSEDLAEQFMVHNGQVRDYVKKFSAIEHFTDKEEEIATLAAILHDITKGWGDFLQHGKEGGEIAEKILRDMGVSHDLANSIRLAIERHMGPDGYPTRKAKEIYGENFEYPKYQTKVGQMVFECDILTQLTPEGFAKILLLRERDENNLAEDAKRAEEEKGMTIEKARFLSVLESARKSLELITTPSVRREAEELWKKIEEEYK
ncbi:MAG: HD domain-containing protein [Minisyncoccia bacterium]